MRQPGVLVEALHLRRQNRSDRPGIDPRVIVPADLSIDGTDIQTGPATNAVESLALVRVPKHFGAPVIQDDDVELLRPIDLRAAPRPAQDGGVDRQWLSGGAPPEQLQKGREILRAGDHLLHAGNCNMYLGGGG